MGRPHTVGRSAPLRGWRRDSAGRLAASSQCAAHRATQISRGSILRMVGRSSSLIGAIHAKSSAVGVYVVRRRHAASRVSAA